MKRLALALLLVTAVGAGVLLALNRPGADASPGPVITVDSTGDTNSRDTVLTLREAMLLATGGLLVGALDRWEADNVSGTPGESTADTIVFDPTVFPPRARVTLGSALPTLSTGNDTVDGSSALVMVDGASIALRCFWITSDSNTIKGLRISNCSIGVEMADGAQYNLVEGNVIFGNETDGVHIWGSGTNGNQIKGNYIGTNAAGDVALPNGEDGVAIYAGAHDNLVEGNVISGNAESGVYIRDSGTDGNQIKGNYIGTNAAGDAKVPNGDEGVVISFGPQQNTIGGTTASEGNVISGNSGGGMYLCCSGTDRNVVIGNYIGTNASGANLGNGMSPGVEIAFGAQHNLIGDVAPGAGNVIAFNGGRGVLVSVPNAQGVATVGNTIRGNSIHSNYLMGIENYEGGNTELAPPVVESVGSVFGTACPNCTIDVYSDEEDEGEVYEGSTKADGGGNWSLPVLPQGPNVTATATDSDGNTSQFSEPLTPPWPTPTATGTAKPTATATATARPTATPSPTPTPPVDRDGDTVPDDVEGLFGSDPADPDSTPESFAYDPDTCTDGEDNDGDGLTDGQDQGCADADGDGFEDVLETQLGSDPADSDSTPEHATIEGTCTDGLDNDGDGLTDGDDEGCPVTPPAGPTRTLTWGTGWHNETWSGASTPEEAFACAAGSYAAAYRLVNGSWERYFPDRPEMSNMTDLEQYAAFLILITRDVTCHMPAAGPPGSQRTLDWGVGWNSAGWTGPDGTAPQDAFACASGSYAAAYRLVSGSWERYFPDRPEMSNMGPLNKYDAFLILVTQPVSCTMSILP